jgi:three-Cys-motif partner protein
MQPLTGMEWLKIWIRKLEVTNTKFKDEIQQIIKIKPTIYNEFREWTPLKLILLNYALDVCTMIVKNMPFFKNKYYIDLFAGSGINRIKDTEDFLIGSPLIASLNHSKAYTSMIFCEKELSYSEALNLRLKVLKNKNLVVERRGYELCLDNILKKTSNRNTYSFFFVDPYSTEFIWDSMKKILGVRSDIVFTFMSSEIFRAVSLANSGIGTGEGLTRMFGDESWKNANNAEELVKIYKQNILKERADAPIRQ